MITNYLCKSCNYKFKRKEETEGIACPYCGSKSVVIYKPTTADDLLNSVD